MLQYAVLGLAGADIAAPGDYDGDGKADFTAFRSSNALWTSAGIAPIYFGAGNLDLPLTLPTAYRYAYRVPLPGQAVTPLR